MIEVALVDADIVAYRCAAACENEDEAIAHFQVSEMMRRILHETNAMEYRAFLTGSNNFRYAIYPEYKANRKDKPKPKWLQSVREHLVTVWNATVTDGIEADDAMAIAQSYEYDEDQSVICSIDKDMLQVPGLHYNFVKGEHQRVSPLDGMRFFYKQLILGDRADNIFGYDGVARQTIPKFLQPDIDKLYEMQKQWDMFCHVRAMYNDDTRLLMNGQCLWIQRKENDLWQFPIEKEEDDFLFGWKSDPFYQWEPVATTVTMDGGEAQGVHSVSPESSNPQVSPEV
jgi:hypothetical protein